jgi:hypothetical protein
MPHPGYGEPLGGFVTVSTVAPPDENLVAFIATVVSFAIVLPLLVKWWPKSLPKPGRKRKPSAAAPPPTARPTTRQAAPTRPIAARPKPGSARPARPAAAASGRPRRPS